MIASGSNDGSLCDTYLGEQVLALHQFDCARANKSTSAWGVEARVPFLDVDFVDLVMSINPEDKLIKRAS